MSPKMHIFLLKLFLLVSVSARSTFTTKKKMEVNENTYLPASHRQKMTIVQSICENELTFYLKNSKEKIQACTKSFGWRMDEDRSGLQLRCRSSSTVTLEMPVSERYQLLLLLPEPNDEKRYSVKYFIQAPHKKYAVLGIKSHTNYSIYSSVLDEYATPLVWHKEGHISEWKVPENKTYDLQVQGTGSTRLVTWNRTGEFDACFELFVKCHNINKPIMVEPIWPGSPLRKEVEHLPQNYECFVTVKGMYETTLHFNTFVADTTSISEESTTEKSGPEELNTEVIEANQNLKQDEDKTKGEPVSHVSLNSEEDGDRWTVHVWWPKPDITPDSYNLTMYTESGTFSIAVPGDVHKADFRNVVGSNGEMYTVSVYNFIGYNVWHNSGRAVFLRQSGPSGSARVWAWAGAAGGTWCVVALAAAIYWRLKTYKPSTIIPVTKPKPPVVIKPLDIPPPEPVRVGPPVIDVWNIKLEQLVLHELIGEGAFGVVRRGTLAPLGKEVAVKMLKDFPSQEEMRAFRVEMELMKSVSAHPHVVSLIGCCIAPRAAIVAEYCSRGDLLSFLRCSWDSMVSKSSANYYNNNISISDYQNDLFQCKMPQENSRLVVNKMYEVQKVAESDLTLLDLLSYCRQIAMGMEFLALNKVVHRDLAARNVLVTRDKTLKIADFGLSRDVYEENQYKQKGNGKMPVKWMALESLTRRIYTTQSDVWSFGVVVWEVVTVGGAPYPGVAATRLPRLLRAGYRMPRPPNCTPQLYELMRSCWATRPRDRPTFTELHASIDELIKSASADEYLSLELDVEPPPPTPLAHRYFRMIMRTKRNWSRGESYERPLKAPKNHYSSPPVMYKSAT